MKKKFFLVGIIAAMSLGAFLVSCSKDDDDDKCCCDGDCVSMSEVRAEGYKSCAEAKRDLCN